MKRPRFASAFWIVLTLGAGLLATVLLGWMLGLGVEAASDGGRGFLDAPVAEEMLERHSTRTTQVMKTVTWLGNRGVVLGAMALAISVLWLALRDEGPALFLAACVLGGYAVSHLTKDLVNRVRPVDGLVDASGGSFPSGHSVASVTLYGGLAVVAWRVSRNSSRSRPRRTSRPPVAAAAAWTTAVLLIFAIGASRLYLGVHWTTDVVGGILLGTVWIAVCAAAWSRWERTGSNQPLSG